MKLHRRAPIAALVVALAFTIATSACGDMVKRSSPKPGKPTAATPNVVLAPPSGPIVSPTPIANPNPNPIQNPSPTPIQNPGPIVIPTPGAPPSTVGAFAMTGQLVTARVGHSATKLKNGDVIIVGGMDAGNTVLSSVEVYDSRRGIWGSLIAKLGEARAGHAAVRLNDGRVWISGGTGAQGVLQSTEYFDPNTGGIVPGSPLLRARTGHAAVAFTQGGQEKVLVFGGASQIPTGIQSLAEAEVLEVATGHVSRVSASMLDRLGSAAINVANNKILAVGGVTVQGSSVASAQPVAHETFDIATGLWSSAAGQSMARAAASAALLANGDVLVTGGRSVQGYESSAELYSAATGAFQPVVNMDSARSGQASTLLLDGRVLITGGGNGVAVLDSAEVFGGSAFAPMTARLVVARAGHTATLLDNGRVLIVGGADLNGTVVSVVEEFDASGVAPTPPQVPVPVIVSANPASGKAGDVVTIDGSNFDPNPAGNIVTVSGVVASVSTASPGRLVIQIPAAAAAGPGEIRVTVQGVSSNGLPFTVSPVSTGPVIASVSPQVGREGQLVTIAGDGFSLTQSVVRFGGLVAQAQVLTTRLIMTNVPQGSSTGAITVEVAGQVSNPVQFTVVPAAPLPQPTPTPAPTPSPTPTPSPNTGTIKVDFVKIPTSSEVGKRMTVTWDVKDVNNVFKTHVQMGPAPGNYTYLAPVKSGAWGQYTNMPTAPQNAGLLYLIVETDAEDLSGQRFTHRTPEQIIQILLPGQQPVPLPPVTGGPSISFKGQLPLQVNAAGAFGFEWEISGVNTVDLTSLAWGEKPGQLVNFGTSQNGAPGTYQDVLQLPATLTGFVVKARAVVNGGTLIETPEQVIPVASASANPGVTPLPTTPPMQTASIDVTGMPGGLVQAGDIFSVEFEIQNAMSVSNALVRWGSKSGQYTNSGTPQSGSSGLYSQVVTAPTTAGDLYLIAEAVADGQFIQTAEEYLGVLAPTPGTTPTNPTSPGTTTPTTPTTGGGSSPTVPGVTPVPNTSKITLKSVDYAKTAFTGDKLTIRWNLENEKNLSSNLVAWGTSSGTYGNKSSQAGKRYWLFGDYEADITLPAKAGAAYFRIEATDANGAFKSSEYTIQVNAAPTLEITAIPSKVEPGAKLDIGWTVKGGSKVSRTFLRWGRSSKSYFNLGTYQTGGPGKYNYALNTSGYASGDLYVVAEAEVDGRKVVSGERKLTLAWEPKIDSVSFPNSVFAGDTIKIKWDLDHVSKLDHTHVHWGSAAGSHTTQAPKNTSKPFLGIGGYSNEITAPTAGKIYFVVHVQADNTEAYSKEYVIDVKGRATVDLDFPKTVDGNSQVTIAWTVKSANRVTNTQLHWNTGGVLGGIFGNTSPLQNGSAGRYFHTVRAPRDGVIKFHVTGYADGQKFSTQDQQITVKDAFSLAVNAPSSVAGGQNFEITWTVKGAQSVTDTYVNWGGYSWIRVHNTTFQKGGAGTYKATIKAFDKGEVYFTVKGTRDGKSFESSSYKIDIKARILVDVSSAPSTVKPGAKYTIKWSISNINALDHANVHWGNTSGTLIEFGSVHTSKSFWGSYSNDLQAPKTGSIFYTVHVKADGQEVFTPERVINVR